jgi:tripartite-type tricarboxylate transporter receptor subunit TctC
VNLQLLRNSKHRGMSGWARGAVLAGGLAAGVIASAPAAAQDHFPERPVRIIVPFPAGGTIDLVARHLSQVLGERFGQPVIIDNRAGANGIIGTQLVAESPPDGHTLLLVTASFAVNQSAYKKLPYDVLKDFAPITPVARGVGLVLAVHPSVTATTVAELVRLTQQPGARFNYSSPGIGNTVHLATEMFKQRTGAKMLHVPYKGSAPALNALLGGEVEVEILPPGIALSNIKAGKVKVLAFTGGSRLEEMPDVPTMAEAGVEDMVFEGTWIGLFAPAATPKPIIDRIYAEVRKVLESPEMQEKIRGGGSGYVADGRPPEAYAKQLHEDVRRYADAMAAAGIEQQ